MAEDFKVTRFAVYEFFHSVNERDLDRMAEVLNDAVELQFPKAEPFKGKKKVLSFFKILFRQFPELGFIIQHIIIEEAKASVHWVNRGVFRDGSIYENEGVTLFEAKGNEFLRISEFLKNTENF